jgi:hypothetical protein
VTGVEVLAFILINSTGVFLPKEELQQAWLIKETLKAAALTIKFFWILTLFGGRNMARGSLTSRMGWILAVLAGVMVFGISIEKFAGTSFELLHRMNSIERYISVRLDLWGLDIEAF